MQCTLITAIHNWTTCRNRQLQKTASPAEEAAARETKVIAENAEDESADKTGGWIDVGSSFWWSRGQLELETVAAADTFDALGLRLRRQLHLRSTGESAVLDERWSISKSGSQFLIERRVTVRRPPDVPPANHISTPPPLRNVVLSESSHLYKFTDGPIPTPESVPTQTGSA
eukprot:SAG31_NODE_86_length_26973_cov_16.850897_3_plen_172_part_00